MAGIRACYAGTVTNGAREQPSGCLCGGRTFSGAYVSTSALVVPSQRRRQLQRGLTRGMFVVAKRSGGARRDDREPAGTGSRNRKDSGGFQFSNRRGMYRVQYNQYEAEVRQDEAWKLAVPLLGGLVLMAGVIGPLIIGLAFSAIAVGAALSAGAIFTSLFLPFFILIAAGALFFGGVTFSAFAALGSALLLPKLIGLAVVGGGMGLGALTLSLFLKPAAERARVSYEEADRSSSGNQQGAAEAEAEEAAQVDVEGRADPEVDRQLREFDELLAGREEQRLRTDRWRSGGGGVGGNR